MSGFPDALPGDTTNWKIPNSSYTITGHSRAGERTGFCLTSHGIFFDAGIHCWNVPKFIFVTHSHTDHSFALPMMTATLSTPAQVYVPTEAAPFFNNHLQATAQLNACSAEIQPINCVVNPVNPKDKIIVNGKGIHWEVDIIRCPHRVPSVGYCVSEIRQKLKEEYAQLKGKEIGELKKKGVEITKEEKFKQFIYMGDTTHEVFNLNPEVFEYKTIFIECTFFLEGLRENALKKTHVHWDFIKPFVKNNPQTLFMLIHFTLSVSEGQIVDFFKKESETEGIYNVGLWLDSGVVVLNENKNENKQQ